MGICASKVVYMYSVTIFLLLKGLLMKCNSQNRNSNNVSAFYSPEKAALSKANRRLLHGVAEYN